MAHTLSYTVNCSILLTDLPLLQRPSAAKAAGFGGVEFWWPFATSVPADTEVDAFVRAVEDSGVQLTGLNFAAGDMAAGDRGLVSWPGREQELRDNVDIAVDIGKRLGCRTFNALYGNRVDGVAPQEQDDLAVAALVHAARAVAPLGGQVVVEPLSGADRYPLLTSADAVGVIETVARVGGVGNVRLLADLYHLAVNGDDVGSVVGGAAETIGHVQIADAPGRGAPGTGDLPLQAWLTVAERTGYRGWVGLEYKADPGSDPFAWLAPQRRASGS